MKNLTHLLLFGLVFGGSALANEQLLFTELSSSHLSVTLGGSAPVDASFLGDNHWSWLIPEDSDFFPVSSPGSICMDWAEPARATGYNHLSFILFSGHTYIEITSDEPVASGPVAQDGAYGFTLSGVRQGQIVFGPFDVYFRDAQAVPESASTLALLCFSCGSVALVSLRRQYARQRA